MKAYRGYDGKLRLFRPQLNCERMRISNDRVCLPDFDAAELLKVITTFLALECPRWLPEPGSNLYVRPTMIGSGSALGIQRPREALFFLFAALFPQSSSGSKPSPGIKLLASDPEQIRAWPGGFGYAKVCSSSIYSIARCWLLGYEFFLLLTPGRIGWCQLRSGHDCSSQSP